MLRSPLQRATIIKRPLCRRPFSSHAPSDELEIGYVPEHYCGPLHLARSSLETLLPSTKVTFRPFLQGTGHMIEEFKNKNSKLDLAIGLTESWVGGVLNTSIDRPIPYRVVGQWVNSPLRWAIVSGYGRRKLINKVDDLQHYNRAGVSRLGSGSHIMAMMLAQKKGWFKQEEVVGPEDRSKPRKKGLSIRPLGGLQKLQMGVKVSQADFFMWEHFTTKPSFTGNKPSLLRIGEMYAPWPAWMIAARTESFPDGDYKDLEPVFEALNNGVKEFSKDSNKTIQMLGTGELQCKYNEEDAKEWMESVEYVDGVKGVDEETVRQVAEKLQTAGFIKQGGWGVQEICGIPRPS